MPHPRPLPSGSLTLPGYIQDDLRTGWLGVLFGNEAKSSSAYMFLDTS